MYAWREALARGGASPIQDLFGLELRTALTCAESGETQTEASTAFNVKCNITIDINHLNEGLRLALKEEREKTSDALGRVALWQGETTLTRLPPYLTVQLMRFFYKVDTQSKAKILRKARARGGVGACLRVSMASEQSPSNPLLACAPIVNSNPHPLGGLSHAAGRVRPLRPRAAGHAQGPPLGLQGGGGRQGGHRGPRA